MKRPAIMALGICSVVTAIIVVLAQFNPTSPSVASTAPSRSNLAQATVSNGIITGTGDIPSYPGAQTVDVTDDAESIGMGAIEYHANVPNTKFEQVAAFYEQWLAENGWVIVSDRSDETSLAMEVTWNNKAEGPPTRRYMLLGVQTGRSGEVEVHVWHQRWPEPLKLPVIPEAQQIATTWESHPAYTNLLVTTFLVDMSPEAVVDYYRDLLPQYGWGETVLEMFLPGMAFRGRGSTLVLNTEMAPSRQTLVKIQAYGQVGRPPEKPTKAVP